MDRQWWTERRREGPLTVLTNRAWAGETIQPAGLSAVQLTTRFSDLDLAIMGQITLADAYPQGSNLLERIDPVRIAPSRYHLGVCVCFSRTDIVLFDFDRDHRALGVYRSSADLGGAQVACVTPKALTTSPFGVALRVVRRGEDYHFQARSDATVTGHLAPEPRDIPGTAATAARIPGLFDGLVTMPAATSTPDLARWSTIATVNSTVEPQAIGLIVDNWRRFVTGAFFNCNCSWACPGKLMAGDVDDRHVVDLCGG